jgi:acyl-coenzyme A thioesterase PaaI-like protein
MTENTAVPMTIGKMRWMIFLLGLLKIPLIGYLRPKLILLNDESAHVRIRFRRRSKNHLNSMYFGALAVGADVAGGIHAFYFAGKWNKKVSFAFKSMQAEFLKRAESDTVFECNAGREIERIVLESFQTQERINHKVRVDAKNTAGELVAVFDMEISVKVK